jgi:hypothetical protein
MGMDLIPSFPIAAGMQPLSVVGMKGNSMETAEHLLNEALEEMEVLHASMIPNDSEQMDAIVPAAAVRRFVDAHARLLYERRQLITSGKYES